MLAALLVLTGIVFAPTIRHDFIAWDDQAQIYQNPNLNPVNWRGLLFNWNVTGMTVWMPLSYLTWGAIATMAHRPADASGVALSPAPFHAACVLFHLIAVTFAFLLLRRSLRGSQQGESDWPAMIGAAVFALHPLQVEPVAWASGMYTVLSGALSLAAIDQYVRAVDAQKPPARWTFFASAMLLGAAAMLCKPSAIVLPAFAGMIHVLLLNRKRPTQAACAIAIWSAIAILVYLQARRFHPAPDVPSLPIAQRLIVAGDALSFYLGKLFLPIHLVPDYGRWPQKVIAGGSMLWMLAVAFLLIAVLLIRRAPRVCAGASVFVVGLAPFLGLVRFDYQFYSTVADRYTYLSIFGAAIALSAILAKWGHRAPLAFAVACVIAMGALSFVQMRHWRDTRTLFEYTLTVRPDSLIANKVMGLELSRSDPQRAAMHFEAALHTRPDDAITHYNYALLLARQRKLPEAIEHFRATVDLRPDHRWALYNLGIAMWRQQRFDEAQAYFERAIEVARQNGQDFAEARAALDQLRKNFSPVP